MPQRGRDGAGPPAPEPKGQSLPPMQGASAQDILEQVLPIVLDVATKSSAAMTEAASAVEKLDRTVDGRLSRIETEISILKKGAQGSAGDRKAWISLARSAITSPVALQIVQILVNLLLLLLGYYRLSGMMGSPLPPGTDPIGARDRGAEHAIAPPAP